MPLSYWLDRVCKTRHVSDSQNDYLALRQTLQLYFISTEVFQVPQAPFRTNIHFVRSLKHLNTSCRHLNVEFEQYYVVGESCSYIATYMFYIGRYNCCSLGKLSKIRVFRDNIGVSPGRTSAVGLPTCHYFIIKLL